MEYILQLEQNQRYWVFGLGIVFAILGFFLSGILLGPMGWLCYAAILFTLILTPFLYGRYKLFLILWLFIVPLFDNFRPILIAGTNPIVYIATAFSLPFAVILFFRESGQVFKDLPFLKYLILFQIVLIFNFFRPNTYLTDVVEVLKIFIEIFIIFCTYFYVKKNSPEKLYFWINLFVFINCIAAIFQKITGIGLAIVEDVPRVQGLLGHPNLLGFVLNLYLPFAIYKFLNSITKKEKNIWLGLISISALTLILTFSKVVLFTFAVMALFYFFYLPFKLKIRIILASLIILIIFVTLNYLLDLKIIENIILRLNNNDSYQWRLKIWNILISDINFSNIWFGHGINGEKYYLYTMNYGSVSFAHNVYLQLLFEYGLTSIFFYLSFLIPFFHFIKGYFTSIKTRKIFYLTPIIILLAIFINMLSDNAVFVRSPMCICFFIITLFYLKSANLLGDKII